MEFIDTYLLSGDVNAAASKELQATMAKTKLFILTSEEINLHYFFIFSFVLSVVDC